jgi:hypothetical protein
MTEEEAKTKWCCGTPVIAQMLPLCAPHIEVTDGMERVGKCLASACMAWRAGAPLYRQTTKSGAHVREVPTKGECYVAGAPAAGDPWLAAVTVQQGFCGLAGRPE